MAANFTCERCRFWQKGDGELGSCLKDPPKVVAQASAAMGHPCRGVWPQTAPEDFCHEWTKKDDW